MSNETERYLLNWSMFKSYMSLFTRRPERELAAEQALNNSI